jgi:Arc/MetJ family transcription regulator
MGIPVRTNVVIDDQLMAAAMRASGARTKKGAIVEGLRLLVSLRDQRRILDLRGRIRWTGDLERSRRGRAS